MAHFESSRAAWRNERSDAKYQKPCKCPIPWLMNFCASGLAVVAAKPTDPVFPIRYARCLGPSLKLSPCEECPAGGGEADLAVSSAARQFGTAAVRVRQITASQIGALETPIANVNRSGAKQNRECRRVGRQTREWNFKTMKTSNTHRIPVRTA